MTKKWALFSVFTLALAACGPALAPQWLIANARVLGASVAVVGDPSRATPMPGETATVTFLVVAPPDMPTTFGYAFVPCLRSSANLNLPICQGMPFIDQVAMGTSQTSSVATPTMNITVPAAADLNGATGILVLGVVCAGGAPTLDPTTHLPTCTAGTLKEDELDFDFDLQAVAGANVNPDVSAVALGVTGRDNTLALTSWAAAPQNVALTGCAAMTSPNALPTVHASKLYTLNIDLHAVDREMYTTTIQGDPPLVRNLRESLKISHITTAGKLSRAQSSFTGTEDLTPLKVDWDAPTSADATGSRVDFWFVLRDGRGGQSWESRSLCVVP